MRIINLRSDTVTQPTPAMREANIGATRAAIRNFFSLGNEWPVLNRV